MSQQLMSFLTSRKIVGLCSFPQHATRIKTSFSKRHNISSVCMVGCDDTKLFAALDYTLTLMAASYLIQWIIKHPTYSLNKILVMVD